MSSKRTALVTGATGGIGREIAAAMAQAGYLVLVHSRSRERAEGVCGAIDPGGNGTRPVTAALNDEHSREAFADRLLEEYRCIDVLVNNAGGGGEHENWWQTSYEKWKYCHELNVLGPVTLIRRLTPAMRDNRWGRIVNIASVAGIRPLAVGPEYAASKAAVISLTRSLAGELGGSGVTSNSISPGLVMTPSVRSLLLRESGLGEDASDEMLDEFASASLFPSMTGHLARPRDIANAVLFLLSDSGAAVTGQNIVIDGGYTNL